MSNQPRHRTPAAHETSPGIFEADNLPQFDMKHAISKHAYGNRSYFSDKGSRSFVNTYWRVDGTEADAGLRALSRYSLFGHAIEHTSTQFDIAKESTDYLRRILASNVEAIAALDAIELAIKEKYAIDRTNKIEKLGSYITEHVNRYHLLLDSEYIDSHNYEMTGKFAHLRGIATTDRGIEVPVVTGRDKTIATLPSFKDTTLYFG